MGNAGFHPFDWVIFIVYLAGIFLVGSWFSRRQTSTKEFFVAGKRMHWLPVALSVVVSVLSGISFIGHPARAFRYDSAMVAWPFAAILVTPIAIFVLLPFYRRLNVVTAYQYLEKRFDVNVRLLASALFIAKRLAWMALVALAPSLVLSTFTNLRVEYCILIIGVVATVYTGLGGMSAVIWTDVVQFVVLITGQVVMVCYIASRLDGGFGEIWQVGYAGHKAWVSPALDFSQLTFWTMLIAGTAMLLSDIGADQLTVQRLMTTPDEKAARKSLIFNAVFKFPAIAVTLGMGVALWVFYQQFPELLGLAEKEYDKIVPYFVVTQLPPGVSGLVIAAIFAAAMSSFDSGLNCIVTAFTVDWYERLYKPAQSDQQYLRLAKTLTFALGAAVTVLAILIYQTGVKSIIDKSNIYLGFFGGALLGIFLLGTLTRRAKSLPTVLGGIASVAVVVCFDFVNQAEDGSYLLHPYMYCIVSCAVTMLIGYVGSLFGPELPFEKVRDYTMARKPGGAPSPFRPGGV